MDLDNRHYVQNLKNNFSKDDEPVSLAYIHQQTLIRNVKELMTDDKMFELLKSWIIGRKNWKQYSVSTTFMNAIPEMFVKYFPEEYQQLRTRQSKRKKR